MLLAAVGSALPLALFYIALVRAPAAEVSAWFFLVPVVGVLTAWPLLGRDADRPPAGRDGGGVRRALAGARPEGRRAGAVGRLADTAVSIPAPARRP